MTTYKFIGQKLFYAAAAISFLTIIFIPLGIYLIITARKAQIELTNKEIKYMMFKEKIIPYPTIKSITITKQVDVRYKIGYTIPTFATIVPIEIIQRDDTKTRFSLNYFENPEQLALELQKKSKQKFNML